MVAMKANTEFIRSKPFRLSFLGILLGFLAILNVACFSYPKEVGYLLYGSPIRFDDDTSVKARETGMELASKIAEEGIVLLKNERNTLPLKDKNINLFGIGGSSLGFVHSGGGSSLTSSYGRKTLFESLSLAGLSPNPELRDYYESCPFHRQESTNPDKAFRLYEAPIVKEESELLEACINYSDTAIYVVSRPSTEKLDLPFGQYDRGGNYDPNRSYLSLTEEEERTLAYLKDNFSTCVLVLNSASPMELPFHDDPDIGAIIQLAYPGNTGALGLGKILTGEVNPSGRTVDTFATSLDYNPTSPNFSTKGNHVYRDNARYVDYAESIYVGYRYYETALDEKTYAKAVAYPFGHGLSYTSFSWELSSCMFESKNGERTPLNDGTKVHSDGTIFLSIWVENIGSVSGADVIEIYAEPPYFDGKIEKSAANLVSFGKTVSLEPGKGEMVELSFPLRSIASYDCYDSNLNGFMGYELDAGEYAIHIRKNAHEDHLLKNAGSTVRFSLSSSITYPNDDSTGRPTKNLFTTYTNSITGASSAIEEKESLLTYSIDGRDAEQGITYLSRSDFSGTFPLETPTRSMSTEMYNLNFLTHPPRIDHDDVNPSFSEATNYTIVDGIGKAHDDPIFKRLVRQCSKNELIELSAQAGFGVSAIPSIGKPECIDLDGPCGLNTTILAHTPGEATSYPCASLLAQTFDKALAYRFGEVVAEEAKSLGVNGWYAPAVNIHRSPLAGRLFEYFSEDPYLSGELASYVCVAAIDGGLYCYLKHFVADENETGTNSQYHWLTEQALREIYAKPFEIVIKKANVNAIMTSKNRVGSVRCCGSTALLKSLLREEWGFRGTVISDYYVGSSTNDADEAIRAGCDLMLNGEDNVSFNDTSSATFEIALQEAAANVIYTYCSTMHRANTAQGLSFNHYTGKKQGAQDRWKYYLFGIDGVALVAIGLGFYFSLRPKQRKTPVK